MFDSFATPNTPGSLSFNISRTLLKSCPSSQWCHPTILSHVVACPVLKLSQHPGLFQWIGSSHQVAKVLARRLRGKEWACWTGDADSIPVSRRSPGGGNVNPLEYACPENPMDGETWWAILHVVAESPTRLRDWTILKHYVKKMLKYLQIMKENTESAKRFWRRCQSFLLWGDISQLRPLATVSSSLVCESVRNPELCPSPDSMFWYGGKSSVLDLLRPC